MTRGSAVRLEGGCLVTELRAGQPLRAGTLSVRSLFSSHTGARAISLRALECAVGASPAWINRSSDEVLYVLEGAGVLMLDGRPFDLSAETGIYLRPGTTCSVRNPGPDPLRLVSSRCPQPADAWVEATEPPLAAPTTPQTASIVRLSEREACPTGDRWYRVLVDRQVGCEQVTQFVGSIPPGRAPDHYHHYEEVLCILSGSGVMWAGDTSAPIREGSCIYLPDGQLHCVENTGPGELRLLGVFYPAGSPAVRYAPGSEQA